MSITTVLHACRLPAQQLRAGAAVKVELCTPSFDSTSTVLSGAATVNLGRDGSCPLQLTPNSELNPSGTWYQVTDPDGTVWPIVVPVSAGPVHLEDCLGQDPSAPTPAIIVGADIAQSGSVGSSGITGAWGLA